MKRLQALCLALVAVSVVGAYMAGIASASSPTLLFLVGEEAPMELKGTSTTNKVSIESVGADITATGYLLELLVAMGGPNSGQAKLLYTGSKLNGNNCKTEGDGEGLILIDNGEWHLVYISRMPLILGVLYTTPTTIIKCGFVMDRIQGSFVVPFGPANKFVTTTESFKVAVKCGSGDKEEHTKYFNSAGEEETAKFESNDGTGFESACMNITEEVALTPTKMIEVMT
ncbi:MAG TPA: hypothetical protein VK721_04025 [Solirubrobacteraceae bacterium]|jgi:hypothetical protein|nr:hypothetical protein [Solirubrobacteraceae bacterium]